MDNFDLQVTPVELTFQSKGPVGLSCIVKRVNSSGGAPERYELRPSGELSGGRATFSHGATFAISREAELKNMKISLNFFNRNDRNAFLIGSTDLQLNSLPPHPYTLLELKLDNCSDPAARIKLEVQRRENPGKTRRERPQEMGLLGTEGQQREAVELSRRTNPTIPTAYEISRRNYKQVEVGCHEEKKSEGRKHPSNSGKQTSNSGKKGSYLQQRTNLAKTSKFITKNEERISDSPVPRRQTPEPIRIGKQEPPSKQTISQKYAISKGSSKGGHSYNSSIHTQPNIPYEEPSELEPEKLKIQPYEDGQGSSSGRQAFKPLKEDNGEKYRSITEKFQKIHDQIEGSKLKKDPLQDSSPQEQPHHHQLPDIQEKEGHHAAIKSFAFSTHSSNTNLQTPKLAEQSLQQPSSGSPVDRKFQNVKSVKTISPDASPPSEKTVSFQTIPPANHHPQQQSTQQEGYIDDREIQLAEMEGLKRETKALKNDLAAALRTVKERDGSINRLEEELKQCRQQLQEKQGLLGRLSEEYELRFEEVFTLKQRVAVFEEERQQQLEKAEKAKLECPPSVQQADLQSLKEQLAKARRLVVESESQLRFKQNQSRRLLLQMDNLKREKRSLEQQVHALVSRDKNELTRQASLARIENLNSSSLANHAKRQNQALRAEVKLLQQKLESLNGVFQSLLSGGDGKGKAVTLPSVREGGEVERRVRLLQEKCGLLQQQLKEKKNQLAEIINVIWKHEDGDIMNDVLAVIATEKTPN